MTNARTKTADDLQTAPIPWWRTRTSWYDAALIVVAMALPLAYIPGFESPEWTPRIALLLAAFPIGMVALVGLVRTVDRAAIAAASFLLAGVASNTVNHMQLAAWRGFVGRYSSWLILALMIGLWALGRQASDPVRRLLPRLLIASLLAVAVVGVVQLLIDPRSGEFVLYESRPTSTTTNPIFYGVMCAGGYSLAARLDHWVRLPLLLLFAGCTNLAGSRVALGGVVAVVVFEIWRRKSVRESAQTLVATIGGFMIAEWILASIGRSISAGERAVTAGGLSARFQAWQYGVQGWAEKPVLGHGVANFRPAIQDHFSATFVRTHIQSDGIRAWHDAHNIVVEILTTMGIVGLVAGAAFAWFATRRAHGPLATFASVVALSWIVEPMDISSAPVALLALGASVDRVASEVRVATTSLAQKTAAVTGAVFLVVSLGSDLQLKAALDSVNSSRVETAAAWFPGDPEVAQKVMYHYWLRALDEGDSRSNAIKWGESAARWEPDRTFWTNNLARFYLARRLRDDRSADPLLAVEALERSVSIQETDLRAWELTYTAAELMDDRQLRQTAADHVCELSNSSYVVVCHRD